MNLSDTDKIASVSILESLWYDVNMKEKKLSQKKQIEVLKMQNLILQARDQILVKVVEELMKGQEDARRSRSKKNKKSSR